MKDRDKTKAELISELAALRERIAKLQGDNGIGQDLGPAGDGSEESTPRVGNIREVFWMANGDLSETIYVSPSYETLWGQSCESLYDNPRSWMDAIHPQDLEGVRAAVDLRLSVRHDMEYRIVRPDGSVCWIRDRRFPVQKGHRASAIIAGIAEDITGRKRMEAALRASQEYSDGIVNATDQSIFLIDTNGITLAVNAVAARRCGVQPSDMAGRPLSDFFPRDLALARKGYAQEVIRTGKPIRFEDERMGRHFDITIQPIRNDTGQVTRLVVYANDITAQREAEEGLRESEEKYRNVFATENDALFLSDRETGTIREVNDAACTLYGYRRKELTQMRLVDISAEPEQTLRGLKKRQKRVTMRLHKKKDGTLFPVDISAAFFALKGKPFVLSAVRDITEMKAAEEELKKHRQKLELLVHEQTSELEMKSKAVEELNVALKVLLRQVQEDKEKLEQRFVANVNKLVLPYLQKIRKGHLDRQQNSCLDVIEANLDEIMSPFLHNVQQLNLTPREAQVANMIKEGKSTKEIAEIIGVAPDAVNSYRNGIRLKLGLNRKKVNLQSYLQSLK